MVYMVITKKENEINQYAGHKENNIKKARLFRENMRSNGVKCWILKDWQIENRVLSEVYLNANEVK